MTEIRYRRWLLETQNLIFSPPQGNSSGVISEHLEIVKQLLPADAVKGLDYQVDRTVYPFEQEFEHLRKEIVDVAKSATVIAFGASNRRIHAGFIPLAVLFPLAALAGQRFKFQRGKDTLKIAYIAPTFDNMTVHTAIQLSAAGLHEIDLAVAYIRHSCGLSPLPTLLRTDNPVFPFQPHWRHWKTLKFPPHKRGTTRLWFQPEKIEKLPDGHLGKNVIEVKSSNADAKIQQQKKTREHGVCVIWYHDMPSGEPGSGVPKKKRFYSSRHAWNEANNAREVLAPLMDKVGPLQISKEVSSPRIVWQGVRESGTPPMDRVKEPNSLQNEDNNPRVVWQGVRESGPRILWRIVGGDQPQVKRQHYLSDDEDSPTVTRQLLGSEKSPIMLLQRLQDGPRIIKHAVRTETRPVMLMQRATEGEGPRIIKHMVRSEDSRVAPPEVNPDGSPIIIHVPVGPSIRIVRDVREYIENDRQLGLLPEDEETQSETRSPREGPRIRHHVTARMVNPTTEHERPPQIIHSFDDEEEISPRIVHSFVNSAGERRGGTGPLQGGDHTDLKPIVRYHPTVSPESWYNRLHTSPKTLEDYLLIQKRTYSTSTKVCLL